MPQLRAYAVFGVFVFAALLGVLSACISGGNVQPKPETFVGEYVYYSADKGAVHDADKLTLKQTAGTFLSICRADILDQPKRNVAAIEQPWAATGSFWKAHVSHRDQW